MQTFHSVLSLLCLAGLWAVPCWADLETITLNSTSPFALQAFGADSEDLAIYDSSLFSGVGDIDIREIVFHSSGGLSGCGPVAASGSPIRLFLGTTSIASAQLNSTYANNISDGETSVFTGTVSVAGSAVEGYTISILLSTPFDYIPADGNLLLGIQNTGGGFMFSCPINGAYYALLMQLTGDVDGVPPTGSTNGYAPLIQLSGEIIISEPGFLGGPATGGAHDPIVDGVPPTGSNNGDPPSGEIVTPEPGFLGVLAIGIPGLLFAARRRKSNR